MKIEFSSVEFRSIVSVGVAASKGDITPIIESINLSSSGGEITAVATDRYRIARSKFTPRIEQFEEVADFDITVDAQSLTKFWNSVKVQAMKGYEPITFEITYGDAGQQFWTASYGGTVVSQPEVKGSFPPVVRLIDVDMEEYKGLPEVTLDPTFLADLGKLFSASDSVRVDKNVGWTFHFGAGDNSKPKAVYITRKSERDGVLIDYLVQPKMYTR